jgi:hypothetical protein
MSLQISGWGCFFAGGGAWLLPVEGATGGRCTGCTGAVAVGYGVGAGRDTVTGTDVATGVGAGLADTVCVDGAA